MESVRTQDVSVNDLRWKIEYRPDLCTMGHDVTVYEADAVMGGKLEQVIPRARLNHARCRTPRWRSL